MKRQLPSEAELHAMVLQGKRSLKDLKSAIRASLLDGTATGALRDQISELRGRVADWEAAIKDIEQEGSRATADRAAAIRLEVGVEATGGVADKLAELLPPPFPTAHIHGAPQ